MSDQVAAVNYCSHNSGKVGRTQYLKFFAQILGLEFFIPIFRPKFFSRLFQFFHWTISIFPPTIPIFPSSSDKNFSDPFSNQNFLLIPIFSADFPS